MNKLIFFVAVLVVWQKWDVIDRFINPPPDYAAKHNGQVILYSTAWCGYCEKARQLMNENDIAFYEYDIEKSDEGREQHKKLGGKGVPVLLIEGDVVKGYDPSRILSLAK